MLEGTGHFLNGTELKLGDKLEGSLTGEAIVLLDEETGIFGVEILKPKTLWVELGAYMSSWEDLKVVGNVCFRSV